MDLAPDHAVFPISVAAELTGVPTHSLRQYEREGLISPDRTVGGTRRYSSRDLDRLNRISQLTTEGLNLAGVRRVLELEAALLLLRQREDGTST